MGILVSVTEVMLSSPLNQALNKWDKMWTEVQSIFGELCKDSTLGVLETVMQVMRFAWGVEE